MNDVVLPPWCKGDPRIFVLIHRQALESAVATSMLHNWLDLVFGYKQTGEEAVKAINVFHPSVSLAVLYGVGGGTFDHKLTEMTKAVEFIPFMGSGSQHSTDA